MYNIAIIGATGNVGRKILNILDERNFPINELYLFASKKSAGTYLKLKNKSYLVEETIEDNIKNKKIDYALFSAGGEISLKYAPIFIKYGAIVIDNSNAWRMDKNVPLVVPEVNPEDLKNHNGIIANPNCSTIQAMIPLKILKDNYGLKRVIYSTYQAVSGAGIGGINDLRNGASGISPTKFPYPIFNNCIPQIDVFLDNGYTKEEIKMINETKKILHDDNLKITATTVRVPVINCHSESINIELSNNYNLDDVINLFNNSKGLNVYDEKEALKYPMPILADGKDEVYIGRIRRDFSVDNGLNIWVVADNLRKGAALNAIQILETLTK
ncbi:aspartate-semialdehyde dehydrogenase [Clostridium saudiense]|nr:aspartate-semialdehyde dehydrogenase [Clostridium saudiense]